MRVLVGWEQSGTIREAFKKRGHDAWSCDLDETAIPGQHFKMDIHKLLALGYHWDLFIAHPECRYLCFSGDRWIKTEFGRMELRIRAYNDFMAMINAPIDKICVENSHSVYLNTMYRKPDQNIHPYHFGDPYKKLTCLWLKNLPPLMPTNILPIGHRYPAAWMQGKKKGIDRSRVRAKTYQGIADAMAEQWG